MADLAAVKIATATVITREGLSKPWYPRAADVDGVRYVKIHKWERGSVPVSADKAGLETAAASRSSMI